VVGARDHIGVRQRRPFRLGEQRARLPVGEGQELVVRVPLRAVDGSAEVLSEFAAVEISDAAVDECLEAG
jgi:hypothetical protein